MNRAGEFSANNPDEIEHEIESMICAGLIIKRNDGLYPTELGEFVIGYIEKVELGLIKPGYKTWEKEYIRFIKRRYNSYIILQHSIPDYNYYKKWL